MFKWLTTERAFVYKLLGLFLLLVLIFGSGSHYVGLGSDPYGIVHFAGHLSRGKFFSDYPVYGWFKTDWKPGESYFVLHGNYVIKEGRLFCKYTIGYPLLLALAIKLFGPDSVYFVNIAVLLIILWSYFKLGGVIFARRPRRLFLALFAPFLLVLLIDQVWGLALRPSRDLSALMFLILGLFLGVRSLKNMPRINYFFLFLGSFLLGFSANVRLPNVLSSVPAAVYLVAKLAGRIRPGRLLLILIAAVLCFVLALLPTFVQNQLTSGSPFKPPRPEIVERDPLKVSDEPSPPPLWLGFFKTTAPDTLKFFWRLYGPFFTCLILIGLITSWKSPETRYICLGLPLVFILFYSMWVHLMTRYMLIAQPFLILLAVGGCGWLLEGRRRGWVILLGPVLIVFDVWVRTRMKFAFGMEKLDVFVLIFALGLWVLAGVGKKMWSISTRCVLLALLLFGLFLVRFGPIWYHSRNIFQLPQARKFGKDLDLLVEEGSVVFATKPLSQCVSLFSRSHSIRPFEMGRVGADPRRGFLRILDRGVGLYLIDNSGWKRDAGKSIPLFRQYFDVIEVGKLRADRYNLVRQFGRPVCTVYRIEPWKEKEMEFELDVPSDEEDYILRLNPGSIWDEDGRRRYLELELNGRPLEVDLKNGVNFILLPSRRLTAPRSSLRISSDRPLPSEMDLRLEEIGSDYRLDLGGQLTFPDKFSRDRFDESRLRDADLVRLGWNIPGAVVIPTVEIPDTELVGEIEVRRVRDFPYPIGLRVSLNGEEIADLSIPDKAGWTQFRFRLPPRLIDPVQSELVFLAYPRRGNEIPLADVFSRALFFRKIEVKRYRKEIFLPTPEERSYYLALKMDPLPGSAECPPPYAVICDQKRLASELEGGIVRLILAPADISRPRSRLQIVSADDSCRLLFSPEFFLQSIGPDLVIDIGGEDDWAFIRDGLYGRELHRGRTPVRWTKETASLALPLEPGRGKKISIVIRVASTGPPRRDNESGADLELDGKKIGEIDLNEGGGIYRFPLRFDPGRPEIATLTIRAPPWQPSRYLNSSDSRKLGVMLDWVKVGYSD